MHSQLMVHAFPWYTCWFSLRMSSSLFVMKPIYAPIHAVLLLHGKMLKKKSLMLLTYTVRLLIHPSSTGGVNDVSSSPGHYKYNPLILNMNKAHEANNASLWLNGMMAFWMTHKKLCAPSLIFTKPRQKYGWTDQQTDRSSHRDLRVHVSSDSCAAENIVRGSGEGFEDRGWTYGH